MKLDRSVSAVCSTECTGCLGCVDACPFGAIGVCVDNEGFENPLVDDDKCVQCGKCQKVCPAIQIRDKPVKHGAPIESYAAFVCERMPGCTSGGLATAIARSFLENRQKAVVVASIMNEDQEVVHKVLFDSNQVSKMSGSKYVQSNTHGIYNTVKKLLEKGTEVIFIGTPCQTYAMRSSVVDDTHLFTVDLFCHGVASPGFWKLDKEGLLGSGFVKNGKWYFRKADSKLRTRYVLGDGLGHEVDGRLDPYYAQFLCSGSLRESCYSCHFANTDRVGDLSLGDCGSADFYPSLPNNRAISCVLVNTEKGKELLLTAEQSTSINKTKIDLSGESKENLALRRPASRPTARDILYSDLRILSAEDFSKKYCTPLSRTERFKEALKLFLPNRIRLSIKRIRTAIKIRLKKK